MKYITIRMTPSGRDRVYLSAIDSATDAPIEPAIIVSKRRLIEERERLASRMFNRSDVLEVHSPEIPSWAR